MTIAVEPLTAAAFRSFGDVLDCAGDPDRIINQGLCGRYHDRARLEFGAGGRAGISVFRSELRTLPYRLEMVERHPEGSQAFIPMDAEPFMVIVARDASGAPGRPAEIRTEPGQGVNYLRNTWHGVLTPLAGSGVFAVIDRIGDTPNLEEFWFKTPYIVGL